MLLTIQETLRARLTGCIQKHFALDIRDIVLERPPKVSLGDFAAPVAFELAKQLKAATGTKHNPRQLAETLKADLASLPELDRVEVAGAGYLNFFLRRGDTLLAALDQTAAFTAAPRIGGKLIVEHTSVNPNKAAHIGHLRNAVLGDTLARLLRALGETVEVQNYIDNTGVQVADVVVGFVHIEGKTLDEIAALPGKFDDYCWDLYARVGRFYEEDRERLKLRAAVLHDLESGVGEIAAIADHVAMRVLTCHLETMDRLGIRYEVMPRESEVLHLKFWDAAFDRLKAAGAIVLETTGRNQGCWVMPSDATPADEAEETEHDADKILVRSNGTVNYTGKDIAYHLWKLGQLGMDFHYRPFHAYPDGQVVWISTDTPSAGDAPTHFGDGDAYFNVIDVGQSYAQEYVKRGILAASSPDTRDRVARSAHLSYEKVALTPASCEELGFELSDEERKRSYVNMSGRKGLGVKADDLIDRLIAGTLVHVREKQADLPAAQQEAIARIVAVGALRYFLLKYTRNTVIAFDFKEALRESGETGVYVLYSLVRIVRILETLRGDGIPTDTPGAALAADRRFEEFLTGEVGDGLWSLASLAMQLEEVVRDAAKDLEPAKLAKYVFQLAQEFSTFYRNHNIRHEPDELRRHLLVGIVKLVHRQLSAALDVMGIEVPERM